MDIQKVLQQMESVVKEVMTGGQSDYYDHDKPCVEKSKSEDMPMIWVVTPSYTTLLRIGEYAQNYLTDESVRYDWHNPKGSFLYMYLDTALNSKIYLIGCNNIREIDVVEAQKIINCVVGNAAKKYALKHGKFTDNYKVRVQFRNITLSKLKALIADCKAHNDTSLPTVLRRFHSYRKAAKNHYVSVLYNPDYNEFAFSEIVNGQRRLVGGIIFHGWPETGYQENYSVQLTPSYGWHMHT